MTPREIKAIRPNPGGELARDQLIGRDGAVLDMWQSLQTQSVVLSDQLLEVLQVLTRDHYLTRTAEGTYHYRYHMLARAWRVRRGFVC